MNRKHYALSGLVVALVALAGCSSLPIGGQETQSGGGQQLDAGNAWCPDGQTMAVSNPQTGERVNLVFEGVTTYEGKEVCKAVWQSSGGNQQVAKMVMYFNEDRSYQKMLMYDDQGNLIREVSMSGGLGAGGQATADGSQAGGGDRTAAAGDTPAERTSWCPAGQTVSTTDPQSGESVTMQFVGVITRDGRQVCKAVWEVSGSTTQYARAEMLFTEDRSYQKIVYYDEQGNVVNTVELAGGGTGMADPTGTDTRQTEMQQQSWCPTGQTTQFNDPKTGQRVTVTVEGVVTRDGKQVCKAAWTVSNGPYARAEMLFNEEGTYRAIIYYDEQGNVVDKMVMSSS